MIKKLKAYILNKKYSVLVIVSLSLLLLLTLIFVNLQNRREAAETSALTEEDTPGDDSASPDGEEHFLFTVCIDAGHGGRDRGSDYNGRIEKTDCLALARAVADGLRERNETIRVLMTREEDDTVSLADRCALANGENADYLVSIHRNKGRRGSGVETWISKDAAAESGALAKAVMDNLSDVGISRDRGVKKGSQSSSKEDYYVNRHARMPSCLIELGFINNEEDNALFDQNLDAYAGAICDAILATYELFHTQNPQEAYLKAHEGSDSAQLAPTVMLFAAGTADGTSAGAVSADTASADGGSTVGGSADENSTDGGSADGSSTDGDSTSAGGTPTEDEPQMDFGMNSDEQLREALFGKKLRTTHISSSLVNTLDGTNIEYAQGSQTADRNRPTASLECQAKYAAYNAVFIGTEPLMTEDGKKILYLTFNERYERGYTEHILDVLRDNDIHATFFVTLFYAEENPDLIRRMLNEGHVLGNLSATNPGDGLPSQTIDTQRHEVLATHTYIKKQFAYSMYLFRFPAGKFSEKSLAVVNNLNYQSVFWSFSHMDYVADDQPAPEETYDKFIARLHPGAIYMLRGESGTNSAILGDFIEKSLSLGYAFCTL